MCQSDPIVINMAAVILHAAKEASRSWEVKIHGAELFQHLVPLGDTKALLCIWDT